MNPRLLEAIEDECPSLDPEYERVRLRYLDNVATRIAKAAGLRINWGSKVPPPLRVAIRRAAIEEPSEENPFAPSKARLMAGK